MTIYVVKYDGSKQLFNKQKVMKTCLRNGANRTTAQEIADKIEKRSYNNIRTEKILQMVFNLLQTYKPTIRHLVDLRKGLSLMRPRPDFEIFIQKLLGEHDYEVTSNQIIRGKCVEHEVDGIVRKDGITYLLEVKHHYNYHTPTGLDESRIARATLEDVKEGFELKLNTLNANKSMIVCNTKYSGHAKQYGQCRNILQIGWSAPPHQGLQDLIEKKHLHPVTCLKGLTKEIKDKLISAEIVLMKQLATMKHEELSRKTGLSKRSSRLLNEKAKTCSYELLNY